MSDENQGTAGAMVSGLGTLVPAETDSAEATLALGRRLAAHLQAGDVVALHGDLGAGKTHLAKGIAAGLGVDPAVVTSPTFTIVQEYATDPPLVHLDLYRVESVRDLDGLGLDELFGGEAVVLVEWPERADGRLPAHTLHLRLLHLGADRRRIERA